MKRFILPMLALGALYVTSCSSEEPQGSNDSLVQGEGIGYMSFSIASSDQTRSNEFTDEESQIFNNGDQNEYAICPNNQANVAFFFDSKGVFYGMSYLQAFNTTGENGSNGDHNYGDEHPKLDNGTSYSDTEQYYTYITRWRNSDAEDVPTQVIVVLNSDPDELEALATSKVSKDALVKKVYEVFDEDGKFKNFGYYVYNNTQYFTMSNSVYIDGLYRNATQIDAAQVCATAEQALANPVTVFVERVLAKFQLQFGSEGKIGNLSEEGDKVFMDPFNGDTKVEGTPKINYVANYTGLEDNIDYPTYEQKEWKAYIVNWGINGLENNARLIKGVNENFPPIDYFAGWNVPAYHRSYWAESPDYTTDVGFTTQYRSTYYDPNPSSKFFGNDAYTEEDQTQQLNTLHYLSFNNLSTRSLYKYANERTYNVKEGLKDYGPYRFASHYLIGAQLLIDGVDDAAEAGTPLANGQLYGVSDKYYAYNFYFGNVESYIRYAYRRMATQIADGREHTMNLEVGKKPITLKGISDGYLYMKDATNGVYKAISVSEAADYFTTASSQTIHGDGKVILSKKEGKTIYLRTGAGTTDADFHELDERELTNVIYTYCEPARHYNKGAMYYAVPVQHNFGKTAANRVEIKKDNANYQLGVFGVVRNHWYKLVVSTIGSIGTPVDDPDQPIIPDPEDEYYVALEIVVLPWHIIDNGSVGL